MRLRAACLVTLQCTGALFALLLLAGCRTAGGWTPAEPGGFERLAVESTRRRGGITEVRFGDFIADSVNVSWARGSGGGVQVGGLGTDRSESRQEYRFSLRRGEGSRVSVSCQSSARERNVGLRGIEMRTSARYAFDCEIRPANAPAWQMSLTEDGDEGFTGTVTGEAARLTVHTHLRGNRVTGRSAAAWELRDAEGVVATVDPHEPAVWLSHRLVGNARREAAAAAAVALLIHQRPAH